MTVLAASDITVTLNPQDIDFLAYNKVVFPILSFGGAGKTYGSGNGIPLPSLAALGLNKEIKRAKAIQPADGYVYHFDRTNHKLRIFQVAADPGAPSIAEASGGTPAGSVAAPVFSGTPISPGTPAGTVDPDTHAFSGAAMGNITPAGSNTAPAFSGTPLAAHTHVLTGATGVAAPLVEVGAAFAPAATVLELEIVGQ